MPRVNKERKKKSSDLAKAIRLVPIKIHGSNLKREGVRVKVLLKWHRAIEAGN